MGILLVVLLLEKEPSVKMLKTESIYFLIWCRPVQCVIIEIFFSPQNIRVMAKYYTRVRIKRMSELLDLTDGVSLCKQYSHFTWQKHDNPSSVQNCAATFMAKA